MPKKVGPKSIYSCSCGYSSDASGSVGLKESGAAAKDITVIDKEAAPMPIVEEKCPKCSHKRAFHWEMQTRAADEPATRFYKCEKCECTWRSYK